VVGDQYKCKVIFWSLSYWKV